MESPLNPALLKDLKLYGDRTSSFMTAYPGFKSFAFPPGTAAEAEAEAPQGQIRFMETPRAWIAANEPLSAPENRVSFFSRFCEAAKSHGRRALMVPVTESLSSLLTSQGFHRIQVGSEAIFDLASYFSPGNKDPLTHTPHARALARRGAKVYEATAADLSPEKQQELEALTSQWMESKKSVPLHFLNQVDPFRFRDQKKIFILEYRGKTLAFLAAAPIFQKSGFFYADYIRSSDSKAGTMELLLIESMRILHQQGFHEVSLGICPLAKLNLQQAATRRERFFLRSMDWFFRKGAFPFSFQSIYHFKSKLRPTRWEPLFLVSQGPVTLGVLAALCRVHFPRGLLGAWFEALGKSPSFKRHQLAKMRRLPLNLNEGIIRGKICITAGIGFVLLHVARGCLPPVQSAYEAHGFSPASFHWAGWLLGPLFHNNFYHLSGDVMTFWLLGIALEWFSGSAVFFLIAALGLWASNPLTWALVTKPLQAYSPQEYLRFIHEVDYGSSNAVYAMAGALAAYINNSSLLLVPFAINGLFLCLSRMSWLSLHHLLALVSGFLACRALMQMRGERIK